MSLLRHLWLAFAVTACASGEAGRFLPEDEPEHTADVSPGAPPASDTADVSLFLVGDAGAPAPDGEPVLTALQRELSRDPLHSIVVFLGDNVYPNGLPPVGQPTRKEAQRRLDAQLQVIKHSGARGFFVPGNHDWGGISGADGWNAVVRQGAYVETHGSETAMVPQAGCPGPAVHDLGPLLRLVFLDTQWWLSRSGPPEDVKDAVPCAFTEKDDVIDSLKTVLANLGERRAIIMSHHPLVTGGAHGGYFTRRSHLFPLTSIKSWLRIPLPMIGSAYVAARRLGLSEQDLSSSQYQHMVREVMSAFSKREPLVYAAGHDHNLQVMQFQEAPHFHLVSGTGIYGHTSAVRSLEPTKFARAESGFMRIRAWSEGRIELAVLTVDHNAVVKEEYTQVMQQNRAAEVSASGN